MTEKEKQDIFELSKLLNELYQQGEQTLSFSEYFQRQRELNRKLSTRKIKIFRIVGGIYMPRARKVFDKLYEQMNKDEIADMILKGLSIPKIADYYHVSHSTLGRAFQKKYNMPYRIFREQILKEDEMALKNQKVKSLFSKQREQVEQAKKEKIQKRIRISYHEKLCGQMFRKWEGTEYDWGSVG